MGIVAITTLHHALKNLMMKWLVEVGLHFVVTTDAELRFTNLEKMNRREVGLLCICATYERDRLCDVLVARSRVRRMTVSTTDVVAPVFASPEIVTFFLAGVACKTRFRNFFGRLVLE